MSQEPKKKSSLKTKLIWATIGAIILLGIGIYLGLRLQAAYNRFVFNASQSMIGFSFWAVIILVALVVAYIIYLVAKIRKGKK